MERIPHSGTGYECEGEMIHVTDGDWIRAEYYDQLLALCRIQREIIEKVAAPAVQREYDTATGRCQSNQRCSIQAVCGITRRYKTVVHLDREEQDESGT